MRGRPPKSTGLKVLEGGRGKRPIKKDEPKPAPVTGSPEPPPWLGKEAKKEWERILPILKKAGVLTEADLSLLEAYCYSYGEWRACVARIKDRGRNFTNKETGFIHQRPEVAEARQHLRDMKAIAVEFGLSPASRNRVSAELDAVEDDEFERLLT